MKNFKQFMTALTQPSRLPADLSDVLFEKSTDAIIVVDPAGRCQHVNESSCRILGYSREELLRLSFADIFPPKEAGHRTATPVGLTDQESDHTIAKRKDGTVIPVEISVHALSNGRGVSILRNMSGQKHTQSEPNRLIALYETLIGIDSAVQRSGERDSLIEDIANVAVRSGGFGLAAVGTLDGNGDALRLTALKGVGEARLPLDGAGAVLLLSDSTLVRSAVRTGKVATSDDIQTGVKSVLLRGEALKRNLRSAAAIPFGSNVSVSGVLVLAASDNRDFSEKEIEILGAIGRAISFVCDAADGSQPRGNAVAAVGESEERYRSFFENTTIGLYRTTPGGEILMANQALVQMLGYSSLDELRLRDLQMEGFEPDYPRDEFISKIESEGAILGLEAAWTRTDGKAIFVRESARAVRDAEGRVLYYEGTVEDISERKIAEQTILEKSTLLDDVSRMAKIGGWEFRTIDMKGTWTDETARIHGLDPSVETNAVLGISFYKGESREKIQSAIREAIETGKPYDLELELTAADGTTKLVRTISRPVVENGKVVKLRGTFQDITEFKRAQDRIRYLTRLYATLSQVNQTIMRTSDPHELYRMICDVALQFGEFPLVAVGLYDPENHSVSLVEWKGDGIADRPYTTIDIDLTQYKDGLISTAIREKKVVTSRDVTSIPESKHWREVLTKHGLNAAAAVPFRIKGKIVGVLTFYAYETDIFMPEVIRLLEEMGLNISFALDSMRAEDERRRNVEALADERDRIAMVAETAPGLIHSYRLKPDGTACMPYVSPAIREIYGYSHEDVVNDLSPVFAHFHPDDIQHVNDTIAESARTMTMWHDEFRYFHPVKGQVWIEGRSMPVRETDGSITWHGFIQDITERKKAERELKETEARRSELELQLIQAQKLESLGTLAGGIAHDFNNLLGVIMGYSILLKEGGITSARALRNIEAIEKASERGAALVKQLLTFARKTETVFGPLVINDIVRDTARFLNDTFPKTISIFTDLEEGIPNVVGDGTQIHQVFMNLCINARDAMPQGGTIRIASSVALRDEIASKFPRVDSSELVVVTVTDTGMGMDEDTKRKVFDPFFTTKDPGKGTGLGLALVYSIVRSHGGYVDLESEPGKGATLTIYLPAISSGEGGNPERSAAPEQYPGGNETILVIEDEEMLIEMLTSTLASRGYFVLAAHDGEEGLDLYMRHEKEVQAVITDLGLPKLGGDQVFHRIKSQRSGAKIIIASGFIDPEVRSNLAEAGARYFIQKPYMPAEILRTLRTALDSDF